MYLVQISLGITALAFMVASISVFLLDARAFRLRAGLGGMLSIAFFLASGRPVEYVLIGALLLAALFLTKVESDRLDAVAFDDLEVGETSAIRRRRQ